MATVDFLGIPRLVLEGRLPRYQSVNSVYLGETIREWCRLAFNSYRARSILGKKPRMKGGKPVIGEPDADGRRWHQLKARTYRIKTGAESPPEGDIDYNYLDKINTRAAAYVLGMIEQIDFAQDGINIRTGRTLAGFHPPVRGPEKTILAGPDQIIDVQPISFTFRLAHEEEYANEVLEGTKYKRALYDEGVDRLWFERAVAVGLRYARIEYDRLLNTIGPPKFLR
jgi:hypothetical protein